MENTLNALKLADPMRDEQNKEVTGSMDAAVAARKIGQVEEGSQGERGDRRKRR
jgi:hypothetical protein